MVAHDQVDHVTPPANSQPQVTSPPPAFLGSTTYTFQTCTTHQHNPDLAWDALLVLTTFDSHQQVLLLCMLFEYNIVLLCLQHCLWFLQEQHRLPIMLILSKIFLSMSKQTIFPLGMVYTLHSVIVKISRYLWHILLWIRNCSLLVVAQTGIANITTTLSVSFHSLLMRLLHLVILSSITVTLSIMLDHMAFFPSSFDIAAWSSIWYMVHGTVASYSTWSRNNFHWSFVYMS